jgi:pimeloyl-ACP methyl ester carboxylesterase
VRVQPDWSDRGGVLDYLVGAERPFAESRPFGERRTRLQAARVHDHAMTSPLRSSTHSSSTPAPPWRDRLAGITVPILVLHGTEDPMFPLGHGQALANEIPGRGFVPVPRSGHELFDRSHRDTILQHLDQAR